MSILATGGAADAAAILGDGVAPPALAFDADAHVVVNRSATDAWQTCLSLLHYETGRRYVELVIESVGSTQNSWQLCVGCVPATFSLAHDKLWIGAQGSWGYIAATGGKCRLIGKSEKYARPFGAGDRVGVLMDFDNKTVEFLLNRVPQGVAFTDLAATGAVHVAVSMAGRGARVRIDGLAERDPQLVQSLVLYR